ncbi:MAG: hypothetical protein IJ706_08325 [Clostridia bacterium]|nr:hypothetical protein [Clostridia bacterium]
MDGFRKLTAEEIDARVATVSDKGCSLLLYKDARVDQNILDETFGIFGWQRRHEIIGDNLYCTVSVKNPETGEWVSKQDVGTESYTEKEKGQASDSFKRACFNLGIGRELYTAPFIWINAGDVNIVKGNNGKPTTYDRFYVTDIGYDERGAINYLVIYKQKPNVKVYTYGREPQGAAKNEKANNSIPEEKKAEEKPQSEPTIDLTQKITAKQALTLRMMCKKRSMPEENIYGKYNRSSMDDMTLGDWVDFGKTGQELLAAWDKEHSNG